MANQLWRLPMAACLSMALAMSVYHSARAADPDATQASSSSEQLQEVTVTAQRVATSEERTPVSVNIYNAQDLVREDIHDLQSLAVADPSLQYNLNGGRATLTLRGVSTNNTTEIGAPSVPVVVDDFTVNRPAALDATLFDLAQVEVLRGPQGTLFGRSASAGLVSVITQRPTSDLELSGEVQYGNYQLMNFNGVFNVPVTDDLAVRAALMARRHNGYRSNTTPETGNNPNNPDDEDTKGARVELDWKPVEHLDALLIYQALNINDAGPASKDIEFNYDNISLGVNSDISHEKPPLGNVTAYPMYGPGPWYHDQSNVVKLHLSYDLPFGATLSYLGGYEVYDNNQEAYTDPPWPVQTYPALGTYYPTPFNYTERPTTQNHELRIASPATGVFQYQAGLYYFSEDNSLYAESTANPGSIFAGFVPGYGNAFLYGIKTRSKAVYGQVSYEFIPGNKASLGARYSDDSVHRTGFFIAPPPTEVPPFPPINIVPQPSPASDYNYQNGEASSNKLTYHVGYDWSPTMQNLVYAKVDTGYKPGGFSNCNANVLPYLPETVRNYELGTKNRFNDNRIQFNVAGFYMDYSDEQISTFSLHCSTGLITANAGKSRIYGVESDLTALADPLGRVDFAVSWLNAKFTQFYAVPEIGLPALGDCRVVHNFYDASGNLSGQECDLKGYTLPQAPTITATLALQHDWALAENSTFTIRAEGKYSTKEYFTSFNFPDETQGAYALLNVFVTYSRPSWEVGLFARNLTNTVYLTFADENGGGSDYQYAFGAPRVFGIRMAAHLKGPQP